MCIVYITELNTIFDTFTVILAVECNEHKAREYVTTQLYLKEIIEQFSTFTCSGYTSHITSVFISWAHLKV
jgi:hypothetical protein